MTYALSIFIGYYVGIWFAAFWLSRCAVKAEIATERTGFLRKLFGGGVVGAIVISVLCLSVAMGLVLSLALQWHDYKVALGVILAACLWQTADFIRDAIIVTEDVA